ncbi:hypothetical protein BDR07DRAFT_1488598 [Suillus spraguei]|nr:hypothetical protein BDR07DRAFT_1488598 [Suillus spraguei]
MRFAVLVALAVVASTVPSFAAPTPYFHRQVSSERDTASTDDDTSVLNDFVHPRIGTVVLPGASNPSFNSKPAPHRKRDITADITAALQTLVQEGSSVLSDINLKREADSALPVEERSLTIPKAASSWINDIGNIISLGVGANEIVDAFGNSTRRDLDQTLDEDDDGEDLDGAALQKGAGVVSAGGTVATILSAFDEAATARSASLAWIWDVTLFMTRGVPFPLISKASSSRLYLLSRVLLTGTSTSTPTKRSMNDNGLLGLTDITTPEQLHELSYYA